MNIINIYENYNSYFNADFKEIFKLCSQIAAKKNYKLYLIGGLVRDLLLNRQSLDIDITVEGDAIAFAHILENEGKAKILSVHKDFGTVKVEIKGKNIDFASTRSETYPKKGHLPKVDEIGCPLEKDILRRDFTINSLAISLNQDDFAHLIDYVNGFEDLKNKKIKILHDKSFIDDPTRIIRALKYSSRLGFAIDKQTLKLQEEYLKNINYDMCYKRVKQEIKKTFEDCGQDCFKRFCNQGIYKLISQKEFMMPKFDIESLIKKHNPKQPWLVYFGVIAAKQNIENFDFTKYENEVIEGVKTLINKTFANDFEIYKSFCAQKLETLIILAVWGQEKEVYHYLDNLQKIKLQINGNDLLALGLTPSKKFGEAFDYILKEKIKNPALTKSEELILAKEFFTL